MDEILKKWKDNLKKVKDRQYDFGIHSIVTKEIYKTYNSFTPIYDLKHIDDIETKLVNYRKLFPIIQALKIFLRDKTILDQRDGFHLKKANLKLCE